MPIRYLQPLGQLWLWLVAVVEMTEKTEVAWIALQSISRKPAGTMRARRHKSWQV